MTKLEKFKNDLTFINNKVFKLRTKKRRVGLIETERVEFRKLQGRQKQLNQAIKSLGGMLNGN